MEKTKDKKYKELNDKTLEEYKRDFTVSLGSFKLKVPSKNFEKIIGAKGV